MLHQYWYNFSKLASQHVRYVSQDKPSRMRSPQHPSKATNAINFPPRQGPSAPGRSMPHIHVDFVDVVVYPTMVSAFETLLTDLDASVRLMSAMCVNCAHGSGSLSVLS
jgi:hypothetical protein